MRDGDLVARDELLRYSQQRLRRLTTRMLARFPTVHRWEDTDDVLQQVLVRMNTLLSQVEVASIQDYLRLAATNIRRVLIDLIRHYQGPQGLGANYATPPPGNNPGRDSLEATEAEAVGEGLSLDDWSNFHEKVAELPEEEGAVFDLLWYHELKQEEAAAVLGVSLSTLKRRWQSARLMLAEALGQRLPN